MDKLSRRIRISMQNLFPTLLFLVCLFLASCPNARSQGRWLSLSNGLTEFPIEYLAAHPKDSRVLFAASSGRIYRTQDAGQSWKEVLGFSAKGDRVHCLYVDAFDPSRVYAGTEKGVKVSLNGGLKWKTLFRSAGGRALAVWCLAQDATDKNALWVGSRQGLFRWDLKKAELSRAQGPAKVSVHALGFAADGRMVISTDDGIYSSDAAKVHWERLSVEWSGGEAADDGDEAEAPLEQFSIEEMQSPTRLSQIAFLDEARVYFASSRRGLLQSDQPLSGWKRFGEAALPSKRVTALAASPQSLFVATDRGLFAWDAPQKSVHDLSEGLEGDTVHSVAYRRTTGELFVGTRKGVYRMRYPEITLSPGADEAGLNAQNILHHFQGEPGVLEVQEAAIRYAEVHEDKIRAWRKAATQKAMWPTLSFDTDLTESENVDVDRGGTADPDRFIQGPSERDRDWSVDLSWDLADLVWNNDQTSIDVRSRLMVELRGDILNEVTHLYFERRRLQVEAALYPVNDLAVKIERELRLQELTAGIDALTGGYFSRRLSENAPGAGLHSDRRVSQGRAL